jgi:hypothetical protein
MKVKVKHSLYRPVQTQRLPGGRDRHISTWSAQEGGKVVSPAHRPPLLFIWVGVICDSVGDMISAVRGVYSWFWFPIRGWVDPRTIVWPKGSCHWTIPVTPATFWSVAQCLNQLYHRVPSNFFYNSSANCNFNFELAIDCHLPWNPNRNLDFDVISTVHHSIELFH